jgi:hypothetical protein
MVKVRCTETERTLDAELVLIDKAKMIVILPGYQKLTLYKTDKPHFYTATVAGLEFTCNSQQK